jgi:pSer/pThr/pTyr-binding forkhead associated (FHA) protein
MPESDREELNVIAEKMTSHAFNADYVLVGRSRRANVTVRDAGISRIHCIIIREGPHRYRVIDLASANGTHVNGRRVSSKIIGPEDVIRIGNTILFFHLSKKKFSTFFNEKGGLKEPKPKKSSEEADTELDLPAGGREKP